MIKLVPKFTKGEITAELNRRVALIEKAILLRLQRVGEAFVKNARENGTYMDQTGNLRSSIGYIVLNNGQQISSATPGTTNEGRQQAREIISEVGAKYPKGFVLICVAGMDYAAAVESKGRDVITASSIIAEETLKKSLNELKGKLDNL
jgi:hypothetical protein